MKYSGQIITVRFPISAMAANPEYGNRNSWNSSHPYKYQIDGPLEMDSKKLFSGVSIAIQIILRLVNL